jgi:hypothetical protein
MKHLKIAFAIVFFCLMGGFNSELMAQEFLGNKLTTTNGSLRNNKGNYLSSTGAKFEFYLDDKFMCIKTEAGVEVWRLEFPKSVFFLRINNGNLEARDHDDKIVWQTGTTGRGGDGTHLQLQNDGNLVLYNGTWYGGDGDALWATGTCGGKINGCGETGPR